MAEFFELVTVERRQALDAAASSSGRLPHLREKNIRVVWSLRHLFDGPHAFHLRLSLPLNPERAGVLVATASEVRKSIALDYVGPDKLWAE
ncbi:hypothetical protein GN109_12655 [Collimonas pratensis]|uniref:hypothetical protein n=1 Tax=Collimonas pratensis TaxID=279113 RepID=UPI00143D4870|nr:hypothetical protein [Collimonas pratensis]NKI70270.1 hypothetical protein [Collimonas pratensis]